MAARVDTAARNALALALGAIAGWVAWKIGMPLPWMIGPMIVNTIAAVSGAPVAAPLKFRPVVIPVIGVMLGAAINRETFAHLGEWALAVAILIPFLATAAFGSLTVYRRIGGYDPVTAYFAAMPGGLAEMVLIGGQAGGVERRIAMAHAVRILVTISCVGLFFGLVLGVRSSGPNARWIALTDISLVDYLWLAACALIGVPFGKLLRLPAASVLGPMILSAAAHVAGMVHVAPPTLIVIAAQVVLGTVIGCRFVGATPRDLGRDLWLGCLSTGAMLGAAVLFTLIAARATGIPASEVFLAYSPGGLTEMSLLALAMGQDVAFVSVLHILRILMVIVAAPLVFRAAKSD